MNLRGSGETRDRAHKLLVVGAGNAPGFSQGGLECASGAYRVLTAVNFARVGPGFFPAETVFCGGNEATGSVLAKAVSPSGMA